MGLRNRGFTLIELLVVIGILATILPPAPAGAREASGGGFPRLNSIKND